MTGIGDWEEPSVESRLRSVPDGESRMMRWRRLVRDNDQRIDVSEAMIQVAMGSLLLRRIAH